MAPKVVPSAEAKQAKAVEWFRQSLSAHSFKDLEKALPTVAGVNKMQVKDFIQSLTDEGLIRVEKIGGGNWYWSFGSDTKKLKAKVLHDLTIEHTVLKDSIVDIEKHLEDEIATREEGNEVLEEGEMDRNAWLAAHDILLQETATLERELVGYSDNDPTEMFKKTDETRRLRQKAEKWTDYIEGVQGLLKNMTGDKAMVAQLMEKICGDEYVPGEGLSEL